MCTRKEDNEFLNILFVEFFSSKQRFGCKCFSALVGLEKLHIYSICTVQSLYRKNVILLDINREMHMIHFS